MSALRERKLYLIQDFMDYKRALTLAIFCPGSLRTLSI